MARAGVSRWAACVAAIAVLAGGPAPAKAGRYAAQQEDPGAPRATAPLTILQINDVYSAAPVDGAGGLARVATLKQQMAAAGRTPFLVLAGDFLSPSVASSVFKGAQMVAALNAAGLDLATIGNHEFDFGDDLLIERMREAKWQWTVANAIDTRTRKPIGGAAPFVIKTFGSLKVGFIGLVLTGSEISASHLTHTRLDDPIQAAARYVPVMKSRGATVIVAVTHLEFADDRRLIERVPGIDLIVGGHEHFAITATENRALISKAGSDARFVARIDINRRRATGTVERFYELIPITSALPDDPATAAVVASYETRLGAELDSVVGTSTVPLDATSVRLRAIETNLGDFFADAARAEAKTEVAILNAGSIRGDRVYAAGPLTRRTIIDMHPFGGVICTVAASGRILLQVLNNAAAKLPAAAGQFAQVSGVSYTIDRSGPPGDRVRDVRVNGEPLNTDRTYTIAVPDFLLKGGDNYTMFAGQRVLVDAESGPLLVSALEKAVAAKSPIAPQVDGRITIR